MEKDHKIATKDVLAARAFQAIYPAMQRMFFRSPELEFASQAIAKPGKVTIETRHGKMTTYIYTPTQKDIEAQLSRGEQPPVHVITHGGAFIIQYPLEEGNVARYLASEGRCYVVVPDYKAAPQVQFPVAEEQCYDAFLWVYKNADERGWDKNRISVGGPSAGGKLALNVVLAAIETNGPLPIAVTSEYGCADMSRTNEQRSSPKKHPIVGPVLMDLVTNTYFKGTDLKSPQVSPLFHPSLKKFPPTLILTAEYDTLRHESNDLAKKLGTLGVPVTHHEFQGVDHGFTHQKPVETARQAIRMIGDHLRQAYQVAL